VNDDSLKLYGSGALAENITIWQLENGCAGACAPRLWSARLGSRACRACARLNTLDGRTVAPTG
jgi:hypothetical protein